MRRRANVGLMSGQRRFFTLQSAEFFYDNLGGQRSFFEYEIFINDSVSSFRFIWIAMLWVYGHIRYFHSYSRGSTLDVGIWRLKSIPACDAYSYAS